MTGYFDPSSVPAVCTHGSNWYQRSKGTTYALFGLPDFAPAAGLLRGFHTSLPNPHANGF